MNIFARKRTRNLRHALLLLAWWATAASQADTIVALDSEWHWLKGLTEASQPDPAAWRQVGFDDEAWPEAPAPFWYGERRPSPGTELPDMRGGYTCVFLRRTFQLPNPADVATLTLGAHSDDGFIAWINGQEVARFNMPDGEPTADGHARPALREPIPFQTIEIENPRPFLRAGDNVLAVQAFNASLSGSSDFAINVSLDATGDTSPPVVEQAIPPAGALVRSLRSVEVVFSEPVQGVDAADLRINGTPATELEIFTDRQYVFRFPEPPAGDVELAWTDGHGITDRAGTPHPFAGGGWSVTLDPNAPPPGVVISEFLADNNHTLNDEDGDASDWIELRNDGDTPADLTGWHLTDRTNRLTRWTLPAFSLAPGEHRLIFASGKDRRDPARPLHTDFKLAREGGFLALTDRDGLVVSEFRFYPAQREDVSYGRDRFSPNVLGYFPDPTPGGPNNSSGPGFAPAVRFSRPGGTFQRPFDLVLSVPDATAEIRYTTDGSVPAAASALYTRPVRIDNTTLVRARAFAAGLLPGDVHSEGYVLLSAGVVHFTSNLPLAILHNFGAGAVPADHDQPALLEVFEPTAEGRSSLTNAPEFVSRVGINLRGSSTQGYPKSSFAVETWDEANDDLDRPLLGMPAESDWVFYAPNNFEPVLIHNPFAHDLSRQIGRYSPRTRFVEVYANLRGGAISPGDYVGIYVIEEKIKRSPGRVDIDKLEPEHTTPPEVTGGYLLKIDRSDANERTFNAAGVRIVYQDPPGPEIQLPQRDPQEQYIRDYIEDFGAALNGPNYTDPTRGYRAYVDVPSWIDHHLLNVLTFNVDALRLSAYFYKPRNGKLHFGPLWDFDRALGSTDGRDANPRVWRATTGDRGTDFFNYPWWGRMFHDPDFWQAYVDRYQELRAGAFSLANLHALVDRLTGELIEAQPREVARWPGHRPRGGSYEAEITRLKNWLAGRVDFMDGNFLDRPTLSAPGGPVAPGFRLTLTPAAEPGSRIYYTLDGTDPRAAGGAIAPGVRQANGPVTLTLQSNARVVARSYNPGHANLTGPNNPPISTSWSGPVAATYVVETPPVAITELMFHPARLPEDGAFSAEDFEYLELTNVGETPLNLAGFHVGGGIEAVIGGAELLAPGGRALLVANREAFEARYGAGLPVAGTYTGRLGNDGDRIELRGPLEEPILDFRYDDAWARAADGPGFSLTVVDPRAPAADWSQAGQWRRSADWLGSPGTADPPPTTPPAVRINEVLTHTDPPQTDAVELFNPGPTEADVGGWLLTDDFDRPGKFRIPDGTRIAAGGFLLLTEADFAAGAEGFRLSSTGDEIWLFSANAAGRLTGWVHGFEFGAAANGRSFGRHRGSDGREWLTPDWAPTLGEPNFGPRLGPVILSELMVQPAPVFGTNNNTRDEYLELLNVTSSPQPLFDPVAPTNTWHLRGGVRFDFPPNVTLAPGGRLLVVGFDPERRPVDLNAFRAVYGLSDETPILGPYEGNLSNEGESVRLLRPDVPQTLPGPDFGRAPYLWVDEVDYRTVAPWPAGGHGDGHSLQRSPEATFGNEPAWWIAADPTPGAPNLADEGDADGDGLPDGWERAYGLDPASADGEDGARGDPDGDGATNAAEWAAGTAPNDGADGLALQVHSVAPGRLQLGFRAQFARSYRLQTGLEVGGPWTELAAFPAGEGRFVEPEIAVTNETAGRFFRLVSP